MRSSLWYPPPHKNLVKIAKVTDYFIDNDYANTNLMASRIKYDGSEIYAETVLRINRDGSPHYSTAATDGRAAVTAGTEYKFETLNINTIANYVWEDAGLTSEPYGIQLWIALTMETVAGSAAAGASAGSSAGASAGPSAGASAGAAAGGGDGGDGIVFIRRTTASTGATGGSETVDGSDTVHAFTADGVLST